MASSSENGCNEANMLDPLFLSSSDNPNMKNIIFTGSNFVAWNQSVGIALGAKFTLGFVDQSMPKPIDNLIMLEKWNRCDYMV